MNPLFLPLNAEHFDAFKAGTKPAEYRILGGKFNQQQIVQGRRVVLSRGYGKKDRMTGIIGQVQIKLFSALNEPLRNILIKIYGEKYGKELKEKFIICFDIRIDR